MRRRSMLGLAAMVVVLCGCRASTPSTAESQPPTPPTPEAKADTIERDPALARRLVEDEGAILLDVRTPEEFAEEHLPNAINIPHDQVPARIDEIDGLAGGRERPVVVYCRSGRRASVARQSLIDAGFSQVVNLGGMSDW